MNVLIIGSGGREHALAWQASKNSSVKKIFVAPGNAGTALENKTKNVAIDVMDIDGGKERAATALRAAEPEGKYDHLSTKDIDAKVQELESLMFTHAQNLEFELAASVRDEIKQLREQQLTT